MRGNFLGRILSYPVIECSLNLYQTVFNWKKNNVVHEEFLEHISRREYDGYRPHVQRFSLIANLAELYGNVEVGQGCVIQPFSTLKAMENFIEIQKSVFIGKYVTIHVRNDLAENIPKASSIGTGSVVKDKCLLTNVMIGENCLIEENCVLGEGVMVQDNVRVLPGSVVPPGSVLVSGRVYGGLDSLEVVRDWTEEDEVQRSQVLETYRLMLTRMMDEAILKVYDLKTN